MKSYLLFTDTGPIVILTSYDSVTNPELLKGLDAKEIKKFVAHELPMSIVKKKYATHYDTVINNVEESDELRVLEYDGQRAYNMFSFDDYGTPVYHQP